jgi:hypothetical protein
VYIKLRKDELLPQMEQGAKLPSDDGHYTDDGPPKIQTSRSKLQRNPKSQTPKNSKFTPFERI